MAGIIKSQTYLIVVENEEAAIQVGLIMDELKIERTPEAQVLEESEIEGMHVYTALMNQFQLAQLCKETEDLDDAGYLLLW